MNLLSSNGFASGNFFGRAFAERNSTISAFSGRTSTPVYAALDRHFPFTASEAAILPILCPRFKPNGHANGKASVLNTKTVPFPRDGVLRKPPCSNPNDGFKASKLSCTPHYMDWSTIGTLYIYDDELVPSAVYDVQAIDQSCDTGSEENYSASLTINTSVWGDLTTFFDPVTGWGAPDGSVDMTTDVTAVLDKFTDESTAPHKARCDLDPDVPNRIVNMADIDAVVAAFSGYAYPFDGPTGCP